MKKTFTREEVLKIRDFCEDIAEKMDARRKEIEKDLGPDCLPATPAGVQEARSLFLVQGALLLCAGEVNKLLEGK